MILCKEPNDNGNINSNVFGVIVHCTVYSTLALTDWLTYWQMMGSIDDGMSSFSQNIPNINLWRDFFLSSVPTIIWRVYLAYDTTDRVCWVHTENRTWSRLLFVYKIIISMFSKVAFDPKILIYSCFALVFDGDDGDDDVVVFITSLTRTWFSVLFLSLFVCWVRGRERQRMMCNSSCAYLFISCYFFVYFSFLHSFSLLWFRSLTFSTHCSHRLIRIFVPEKEYFIFIFRFPGIECKLFTWLIRWFMISWLAFFLVRCVYIMQYLEQGMGHYARGDSLNITETESNKHIL